MFDLSSWFKPSPTPAVTPIPTVVVTNQPDLSAGLRAAAPLLSSSMLAAWCDALRPALDQFIINTTPRVSAFLAQTSHESNAFTALVENLNYSANGLISTWPSHFSQAEAAAYARQPERIANRVYANRLGNGIESTGDGWRYRGRGLIQITGRYNYEAFGQAIGMALADVLAYLETREGAAMSAAWFWSSRLLNQLADAQDFTGITRRINGGTNGQADREAIWQRVQAAM